MPLVSVTRARIRRLWFLPGFASWAVRAFQQAQRAEGFLGGAVLPDRRLTFWTMTVWTDLDHMRNYIMNGPHQAAMPRFADWCAEASVVHWEQESAAVPNWREAERRMRAEGRASNIRHPSADHAGPTFRAPRLTGGAPILPERSPRLTGPAVQTTPSV